MERPRVVLLLHSHMPYVRRNGDWPVGEQWILEAWAECYLPLWGIVEDMTEGRLSGRLALTMTPVLAEQLEDPYLQDRFVAYLENRLRQAEEEVRRLSSMGDEARGSLAELYARQLESLIESFRDKYRGRMMEVLREGMDAGVLEVLASAATHAHLPLLSSEACRRAQVSLGLESYRRSFGRDPRGFWLPECAYAPELDALLSSFSPPLEYVVLDHTAVQGAAEYLPTWRPRRLSGTPLVALLRDPLAHSLVWEVDGYPSGGDYREYAKRDYQGHGFQYWRITSRRTPLEVKEVYNPRAASSRASSDATDFVRRLRTKMEKVSSATREEGGYALLLAAYDTELFGHWWHEGPLWLRHVLEALGPECALPGAAATWARERELPPLSPVTTAWNVDGTFRTWENETTRDLWEETRQAENEFLSRLPSMDLFRSLPDVERRALLQAARELLLLEASDWPYMISRDAAAAYARERFQNHARRFRRLMEMVKNGFVDRAELFDLEETDNLFPWLHPGYWG